MTADMIRSDLERLKILEPPRVERLGRFNIVRDDRIPGGTKRRVLEKLVGKISADEIVYASHPFGYGQLALALACASNGKTCTLVAPPVDPTSIPDVMQKTMDVQGAKFVFSDEVMPQDELVRIAESIALQRGAHLMPIGFDFDEFREELASIVKSINFLPKEVWVLAGSGTLARTMKAVWPESRINAVSMGFPHTDTGDIERIYQAIEPPEAAATLTPPYPSSEHYDAKIWRFAQAFGSDGALIWNVA